jgi:hypothetical protein
MKAFGFLSIIESLLQTYLAESKLAYEFSGLACGSKETAVMVKFNKHQTGAGAAFVLALGQSFAADDGLNSTAGRAERSETGLCDTGPLAMTRLSGREHHSFAPKEIKVLTSAFEDVLWSLGIADRTNPAANMVAKRIIELARRGELDLVRLRAVRSADTEVSNAYRDDRA